MVRILPLSAPLFMLAFLAPATVLRAQDVLTIPVSNLQDGNFTVDTAAIQQNALDTSSLFGVVPIPGGGNVTTVDQLGLDNIAVIDQAGDFNIIGTTNRAAEQDGDGNLLSIIQDGTSNEAVFLGQFGDDNILRLRQTGIANTLESLTQSVAGDAGTGSNIAVIVQDDLAAPGARITSVIQQKPVAGASNLLTVVQQDDSRIGVGIGAGGGISQIGSGNIAGIEQIGTDNSLFRLKQEGTLNIAGLRLENTSNTFYALEQSGRDNRAIAIVSGTGNAVEYIRQNSDGTDGDNLAVLSIEGNDNGIVSGGGKNFIEGTAARDVAVMQDAINQTGGNTSVDIGIIGNSNLFGTDQIGDDLFISATVDGSNNSFAVKQFDGGSDATIRIGADGIDPSDNNDIGISQTTTLTTQIADHTANATVTGGDNRIAVTQGGLDRNVAEATAIGNGNTLSLIQNGANILRGGRQRGTPIRQPCPLSVTTTAGPRSLVPPTLMQSPQAASFRTARST